MAIDNFDRKILSILQNNCHTTQRDIADQVCLSAAAVHRRIRRMEAENVILRSSSIVSPKAVGRPTTVIVEISVEQEQAHILDHMKRRFEAAPQIQQCYYVTGDVDFVLVLTVTDMKEYELLSRELFFVDKNVRRFKTLVVMDNVKVGLTVPTEQQQRPEINQEFGTVVE